MEQGLGGVANWRGERLEIREVEAAKSCEEKFHARDSYAEKELQKC